MDANPFHVADRRPVVPKRPGRYASFPVMTRTAPGEILLVYRDAEARPGEHCHGANGDMLTMRWRDGRWSEPELIYEHTEDAEEMECDLTRLADGSILLHSRQWGGSGNVSAYTAISTDGGRTLSPRKPVLVPEFADPPSLYGKAVELQSGDLLLGAYGRRPGDEGTSSAGLISRDGGQSWGFFAWVATWGTVPGCRFSEVFMLRVPDGSLYALLRTNGDFYATRSGDDGRTWTAPERAFNGMACAGLLLSTGEAVFTYRGARRETTVGGRPATVLKREGRLYCCRVSADGGRAWSEELEVDGGTAYQVGSYGMGDLLEMPDGSLKVVYYTSDADQTPWIEECTLVRQ